MTLEEFQPWKSCRIVLRRQKGRAARLQFRTKIECKIGVFLSLLPSVIAVFALAGCSNESRHEIIIYDEAWSSAAAVRNLICVPDLKVSCEREAREGEQNFSRNLLAAFQASPKCETVRLLTLTLNSASATSDYWRLRVDFHPRLKMQPFELGRGNDRPRIGGDDAEHNAAYICEAVKNNGVTAIW
jgi:hypothetical protein